MLNMLADWLHSHSLLSKLLSALFFCVSLLLTLAFVTGATDSAIPLFTIGYSLIMVFSILATAFCSYASEEYRHLY